MVFRRRSAVSLGSIAGLALAFLATTAGAEVLFDARTTCQVVRQCDDGIDNDGDGLIDWDGGGGTFGDPDCTSANDHSESAAGNQVAWLDCESFPVLIHPNQYAEVLDPAPYLELIDVPGLVDFGVQGGVPFVDWIETTIPTREFLRDTNLAGHPDDDPDIPNLVIEMIGDENVQSPAELGQLKIGVPLPPELDYVGGAYDVQSGAFATNVGHVRFPVSGSFVIDDFQTGATNVVLTPPPGENIVDSRAVSGTMVGGERYTNFNAINPEAVPLTGRLRLTTPAGPLEVDNDAGLADRLEVFYGIAPDGSADPLDLDLTPYNALRLDFDYLDSGLNLTLQLRTGDGQLKQQSINVFGPSGPFTLTFPMDEFGLGAAIADVDLIGLILQTGGPTFGSQYALRELAACLPTDSSCGETFAIDFDEDPSGAPIAAGALVERTYESLGVRFVGTDPAGLCGGQVFANTDQPAGFGSAPHVVTTCPEPIKSDISETTFGLVEARFAADAFEACIDTLPVDPSHQPVLRALDVNGAVVDEVRGTFGTAERLCVYGDRIRSVQFSGDGVDFARFDDFDVRFVPEVGSVTGLVGGAIGLAALVSRRTRRQGDARRRGEATER